jgi:hypothetical protein
MRLSCGSGPRRDALKTLPPPNHPPQHTGLRVHTRRLVRGHDLPSLWTPCAGCTHNGADPNREHDFASRMVDLFRAVTLAHRHAPKSSNGLPQAVDGRIMSAHM